MKRRTLFQGCAVLALATALAGCNDHSSSATDTATPTTPTAATPKTTDATPPTGAGGGKYTMITNGVSPFWNSMGKGIDQANKDLGITGNFTAPNPADHNAQVKVFQDVMTSKVDGVGISPIEADAMAATIDKAIADGIPVICYDSDAPKSKRMAYLGTNNYDAGKTAGTEAVKLFPGGGKLIAFVGNMGAQNARDRYNGFKDALKGSNVTFIAEPFEDHVDKGKARKNVEDAITKYQGQGLNGLVGLYSYNGPAIVGAVDAAGLTRDKMKVICFDGEPDTLKNLAANKVDLTVVQKPYEFGRIGMMLLNYIHKDKDIDKALNELKPELDKMGMKLDTANHIIDTGVDVVTPANAQPFLQKLKEKGLEST